MYLCFELLSQDCGVCPTPFGTLVVPGDIQAEDFDNGGEVKTHIVLGFPSSEKIVALSNPAGNEVVKHIFLSNTPFFQHEKMHNTGT